MDSIKFPGQIQKMIFNIYMQVKHRINTPLSYICFGILFKYTTEPTRWRDAHNRAEIGWSTPPSGLYTQPNPPVLSTNGVYELHISVIHTSVDVVNTVHAYSTPFKQHASLTKLDKSRYWAFMSIVVCYFHSNVTHHRAAMLGGVCLCCRVVWLFQMHS